MTVLTRKTPIITVQKSFLSVMRFCSSCLPAHYKVIGRFYVLRVTINTACPWAGDAGTFQLNGILGENNLLI